MRTLYVVVCVLILGQTAVFAQDDYVSPKSSIDTITNGDCNSFIKATTRKCNKLSKRIRKSSDKALELYDKAEDRALERVCAIDERQAESLMKHSVSSYRRLEDNILRDSRSEMNKPVAELSDILRAQEFLDREYSMAQGVQDKKNEDCKCKGIEDLNIAVSALKLELKRAESIRGYIKERNMYMHKLGSEHQELKRSLPNFEKIDYYLNSEHNEYFELFSDRSSSEQLIFRYLSKISGFEKGLLDQANLTGPQTNSLQNGQSMAASMQEFGDQARSKGISVQDILNPKDILLKKEEIDRKKEGIGKDQRLSDLEVNKNDSLEVVNDTLDVHGSEEGEDQDNVEWKRNPLKAKRFIDRIVYNFNLQPIRSNTVLPNSLSISGQLSYQISTKMNIGIGATSILSVYARMAKNENSNRSFSGAMGYNLRSFYDWNFYDRLFVQFNYELNRNSLKISNDLPGVFGTEILTPSALFGLKIKTPSSKRTAKTVEFLYDILGQRYDRPMFVVRFGMDILSKHNINK